MNAGELKRLLKKDGWYFDHSGSRHDVYIHKTKKAVLQIPRHDRQEIATGTLHQLLKDAGLK